MDVLQGVSVNMSGVRDDSVSGMPSSCARLSAMASSRRISAGDRILRQRRDMQLAELLEARLLVLHA